MLMLLCIQVVQINNNEYDWKEKKINIFLMQTSQKKKWTCHESKKS